MKIVTLSWNRKLEQPSALTERLNASLRGSSFKRLDIYEIGSNFVLVAQAEDGDAGQQCKVFGLGDIATVQASMNEFLSSKEFTADVVEIAAVGDSGRYIGTIIYRAAVMSVDSGKSEAPGQNANADAGPKPGRARRNVKADPKPDGGNS